MRKVSMGALATTERLHGAIVENTRPKIAIEIEKQRAFE
jgi:hypothetical protein